MNIFFDGMISMNEGKIPTFEGPVRNLISFPQYVCKTMKRGLAQGLFRRFATTIFVLKLPTMKKGLLLSTIFAALVCIGAYAQKTSILEVFSENGEKFTLIMNGQVQNDVPATNVQATGLKGDFHKVTVNFEDASLGGVTQNFALQPGMHQRANVVLKRNGKYAVRPFGEPQPIDLAKIEAPAPPPPPPAATDRTDRQEPGAAVITPAGTTTTTTTTTTRGGKGESVRMDVGVGEQRVTINMDIDDPLTTTSSETTTTVKTTETRSTGMPTSPPTPPAPATPEEVVKCAPMDAKTFASAKRSVSSKAFADEKKTTARQVLKSNCMSTDQIIEILGTFSFEDDKLEVAKLAHDRCSDPENYWKVNDVFTFSDSIEELDEFLESK